MVIRALSPPAKLERIPAQRLRAYARRMRRRRPIKVREIAEPRRTLELAALLSVSAARQSDTVLRLVEMRIADIWSWAQAVARPEPRHHLPEAPARDFFEIVGEHLDSGRAVWLAPVGVNEPANTCRANCTKPIEGIGIMQVKCF